MQKNVELRSHTDQVWKDVLEIFLEEAIAFCFSEIHEAINWNKSVEFLDQELRSISVDHAEGNRTVDRLVKLYLKRQFRLRNEFKTSIKCKIYFKITNKMRSVFDHT